MATTDQHPAAAKHKPLRAYLAASPARKLALGIFLAVALFNVLGFFGVPLLVRHVGAAQLSSALSRPVTIGRVFFNPNTLDLRIERLHIGEHEGDAGFVDVERASVNAAWASLFRLSPVIEELLIEAPQVRIVRIDPERFNFSDLIPQTAQDEPAADDAAQAFEIGSFRIVDGSVVFSDRSAAKDATLHLSSLQFSTRDLSENTDTPWPLALSGVLNDKGSVELAGTLVPAPLDLALHLRSRDLDLAALEPFFGARLNASVTSAHLNAEGDLRLAGEGAALKAGYTGDAELADVRLLDKITGDRFAGWRRLHASGVDVAYATDRSDVRIGALELSEFDARVILDARGRLNLSHVVRPAGEQDRSLTRPEQKDETSRAETPAGAAPETTSALNLRVGQIQFADGHVNYTDNYIQPNFTADLTAIAGTVGTLATQPTEPAPVELKALLNESDPVAIRGSVNPLADPAFLDLQIDADDVALNKVTPYSTKYLGYPILKGTLTVDLHYRLDQGRLTATNHVVLDQLTFGDHVPGPSALNLPVRLAIALLKDARGRIDVSVPVSGSLSDPQFSVGRLVWSAFVNLIGKAVTSPFTLLAGALGGSEELSYVEFAPGSAELTQAAQAKLDTLAKALAERPEVELELAGRADPVLDEPALREGYVERTIRRAKLKDQSGDDATTNVDAVTLDAGEYDKYLEQAYKDADFDKEQTAIGLTKAQPAAEMKRLLAAHAPAADIDLGALAQRRAQAVQRGFAGKIAESRIHLAPDAGAADNLSPRVEFKLKP